MTGNTWIACSCPDFVYTGWNLNPSRVLGKSTLTDPVVVTPDNNPGEYRVWTDDPVGILDTIYHVVVNQEDPPGPITRICKHSLRVLWDLGYPTFLVEYDVPPTEFPGRPRYEIRMELYWGNPDVIKFLQDGEVLSVTKIERRIDVRQTALGF